MIEAVIFDMDGLMFDTEATFFKGFKQVCHERGVMITDKEVSQLIGCDSRTVQKFEDAYPSVDSLFESKEDSVCDCFEFHAKRH